MWALVRARPAPIRGCLRLQRSLHLSSICFNRGAPENLVDRLATGGDSRADVEAKRQAQMAKYGEKLKAKVKEHGLENIDELASKIREAESKEKEARRKATQDKVSAIEKRDEELRRRLNEKRKKEEAKKLKAEEEGKASPVKPLSSFMNMDKMLQESPESIGKLWTGYHMMRNKISAVIPARTYLQMIETAKKFPQFVLPLPRTTTNEEGVEEVGYEIQYMQWMFLPAPKTTSANAPPPAAVLFTPLAEYKLRQEYAQPSLVLSHYTDLIESKGLVLLRGEITESSPEDGSDAKPSLSQSDAQILTMCLQRFYHIDWALEGLDNDEQTEKRRALLRTFYEKPTDFKLESLVHLALST